MYSDFPNEHDAEIAQKLLDKLEVMKAKVARLVYDELNGIVDYKVMLSDYYKVAEAIDDLTHEKRSKAERVLELYEHSDAQHAVAEHATYPIARFA